MIIWLNGSFGSGKTTVGLELHRVLRDSHIYDPEEVGFLIRDNVPSAIKKADFQDYPLWRKFNYKLLKFIATEYKGVLIVPMTISRKDYMVEIVDRLKEDGIDIKHFTLMANHKTLTERLNNRGDAGNDWVHSRICQCLEAFSDDYFDGKLDTESLSVKEVANEIIEACGLSSRSNL